MRDTTPNGGTQVDDSKGTTLESVVHAFGGSLVDAAGTPLQGVGGAARERSERLATLRRQRMLLGGLRDEAESALSTFPVALDSSWASEAQRQYCARRAELGHELVLLVRALEEALAGVAETIATLTPAEAEAGSGSEVPAEAGLGVTQR